MISREDKIKIVEEDLQKLEEKIKILRAEYNQFFLGARRELPYFTEAQIREIIKKYIADKELKGVQKFRFYNLVARYNVLKEYYNRRLRMLEGQNIGMPKNLRIRGIQRPGQKKLDKIRQQPRNIKDPEKEVDKVRKLYLDFVRSVRAYQGDEGFLDFKKFHELISKKTKQIKKVKKCDEVQYRIHIDESGKVTIKAKPLKNSK